MSEKTPSIRKIRKFAKEVLRVGQKIFFHKRDLMTDEGVVEEWEESTEALSATLSDKQSTGEQLLERIEEVEKLCAQHGDLFYNKKSWVENIEMLLVAAIIVIGVRSFFLQPFIIPTNSMYPSYYGMKPHVYTDGAELPALPQRVTNKVLLGADHYRVKAKSSGQLYLRQPDKVGSASLGSRTYYTMQRSYFPNGKFFVFPTNVREYVFSIGGMDHVLQVPAEFDLEDIIMEKFEGAFRRNLKHVRGVEQDAIHLGMLKLSNKTYEIDEIALAFDVLSGDALFVDRFTYNFRTPEVGDSIVFQTGGIDEYNKELRKDGHAPNNLPWSTIGEDKYYIKRLVGVPGDLLEIKIPDDADNLFYTPLNDPPGYLLRNKKPIEGCTAFRENQKAVDLLVNQSSPSHTSSGYTGYRSSGLLSQDSVLKVPPDSFFAMGDNSPNSKDGRAWGFVAERKVVGRAFLVYYPFTKRWGFPD
ncbi:MAG: signal peptidase I [Opitutales bacterium]